MKIRTLLVFLVFCILSLTLNAQELPVAGGGEYSIAIRQLPRPSSGFVPYGTRIPFVEFNIVSDTHEVLTRIRFRESGSAANKTVRRVLVLDGDERVIGATDGPESFHSSHWGIETDNAQQDPFISLNAVIKPHQPNTFLLAADIYGIDAVTGTPKLQIDITGFNFASSDPRSISEIHSDGLPFTGTGYELGARPHGGIYSVERTGSIRNIAVGVPNQLLGSFRVGTGGIEQTAVGGLMPVRVHTTALRAKQLDISQVTLRDGNDKVLVGPVDPSYMERPGVEVVFFNDFTLPENASDVHFYGQVTGTTGQDSGTVAIELNPSEWTRVYGLTHGYRYPLTRFGAVVGHTMVVRSPRLNIRITSPLFNHVTAGTENSSVLTIVLDARQSSESIEVKSLPLMVITLPQWTQNVQAFQFYDGTTAIGGWPVTTMIPWTGGISTFFVGLWRNGASPIVEKGTEKEIQLKVPFGPNATGIYGFALIENGGLVSATGVESGINLTTISMPREFTITQVTP